MLWTPRSIQNNNQNPIIPQGVKLNEARKATNKMKTIILSLLVLPWLSGISAADLSSDKMMKKILSLPSFLIHEDTVASFRNMLKAGKFWTDEERNISYLLIKGDGIYGRRLFMLHDDGKLYMIECSNLERADDELSIYLYNEKAKHMIFIGSFEESLFRK